MRLTSPTLLRMPAESFTRYCHKLRFDWVDGSAGFFSCVIGDSASKFVLHPVRHEQRRDELYRSLHDRLKTQMRRIRHATQGLLAYRAVPAQWTSTSPGRDGREDFHE